MAKKVKKMAFGGLSRAVRNNISRMPPPNPQSMAPAGNAMGAAPLPNATKVMPKTLGFAKTALDAIKAAGAANPQMRMPPPDPQSMAPAGNAMGAAPMPGATQVMPKTLGFAKTALDTIKANASKYPEMSAPKGVPESYGSIRPMPTPGRFQRANAPRMPMKKGGTVKSSASKRADGIATKGKTKGKIC